MDIQSIRDNFPILERKINGFPLVYFDNAATTQKPREVIEGIVDYYYNHNANIHRGVHTLSGEATEMVDVARKKVADFVGSNDMDQIVFVRNATEALNLIMYTLGETVIKKGDNLVTTMMEHHSNLVPWQVLCKKAGAKLRVVEIDEEGILILNGKPTKAVGYELGGIYDLVDSKTKIVVMTMASNVTGVINPVEKIVASIKKINRDTLVVLDASQVVGHMSLNVEKTGADLIVFSGHKMYGPTGVGVLWGKPKVLEAMTPFLYGGDMISEVSLSETKYAQIPNKFEAGTPAIAEIIGLGYAVDFLSRIGMDEIEKRELALLKRLLEKMLELENKGVVKIVGPRTTENRSAIVSFVVGDVHAHDVATYLDSKGIAVRSGQHCATPLVKSFNEIATVRVSLSFINTNAEIDFCVEQIEQAHNYFVR